MKLSEIKKQNIIVTQIHRDCPILICRNRVTAQYAFFKLEKNNYVDVDIKTQKILNNVFKTTPKSIFRLEQQSEIVSPNFEHKVRQIFEQAKEIILDFVSELPIDIKTQCKKNLDNVTLILNKDAYDNPEKFEFFYDPLMHSIAILSDVENKYELLHCVLHECLHATTSGNNEYHLGFYKIIESKQNGEDSFNVLGCGLNEAFTDYYAYELVKQYLIKNNITTREAHDFLTQDQISGYDCICNAYYNLTKNLEANLCVQFYFNGNLDGFIQYLSEYYHYNDDDNILSLIYKMDMFIDLIGLQDEYSLDDKLNLMFDINKNIYDINKHKVLLEGNQLSAEDFKFLFSEYRLPLELKQKTKFIDDFKKYYLSTIQSNIDVIQKHNILADLNFISYLFYCFEQNKPVIILNEFYHSELFIKMFSSHYDKNTYEKQKCFKWLFSDKTNAFVDQEHKLQTIYDVIKYGKLLCFNPLKFIKLPYIVELINRDHSFASIVSELDGQTIDMCLPYLKQSALLSHPIKNHIIKTCLKIEKEKKINAYLHKYEKLFKNEFFALSSIKFIRENLNVYRAEQNTQCQ